MLSAARRPFAIVGGSRWSEQAVADFRSVAEAWALPVGCTFRRQMLFDHLHPNYAGDIGLGANPALSAAIRDADLVLLVGARFGEVPSADYTLLKSPYPAQALVHVHPDAGELGRVYRPTVAINASPGAFAEAFAAAKAGDGAGLGGRDGKAARILSRLVDAAADRSRAGPDGADHGLARNGAARRRHSLQRRRQLCDLDPSLSTASAVSARRRRRPRARWATARRPPSPPRSCIPTASSSPSPATAAS